jgi:serine/threonine-protein kinase
MEWIEGRSLRQILTQEKTLAPARALKIAAGICDALEYIHSHGVVHRDLKPENVIVGDDGQITLLDFGIARKAGAARLTFAKFSPTVGTADYISPEQVKGNRGDERSDVYAVGVILYEMLTGQLPFTGENAFVIMNARLTGELPRVRQINPDIAPEIESIVAKAMQRYSNLRHSSARELALDLLDPWQIRVREFPPTPPPRSTKILLYSALAALPGSILALMLYIAGHH